MHCTVQFKFREFHFNIETKYRQVIWRNPKHDLMLKNFESPTFSEIQNFYCKKFPAKIVKEILKLQKQLNEKATE